MFDTRFHRLVMSGDVPCLSHWYSLLLGQWLEPLYTEFLPIICNTP
jgi:hypothetical protein